MSFASTLTQTSPAVPAVLLLGSLTVAWARRDQLSQVLSKVL